MYANKLVDALNDDMTITPSTWYDERNTLLVEAFALLRHYMGVMTRTPFYLRWYSYVLPAVLAAIAGYMGFGITPVFIVAVVGSVIFAVVDGILPHRARRHFMTLTLIIHRGDLGPAVMNANEPVWELLETALSHYRIPMRSLFRDPELNKLITPVVADLLTETWKARCKLDADKTPYANSAIVGMADAASTAATTIYAIDSGYRARRQPT